MAETPILGLPLVVPSQNQKEQVVNTAFTQFEAALNKSTTHSLAAGNVTLTARQLNAYFLHVGSGHSVARTLLVPARKRIFAVHNDGTDTLTVQIAPAGSSVTVEEDFIALIHSDGATLTKLATSNSGTYAFTDLTDVPNTYVGQALKYVRVKADESGLEFVTAATVVSGLSDYETEYTTTSPASPATGLELFTRRRAGLNRPATKTASGLIDELQPSLHGDSLSFAQANGAGGFSTFGFTATTVGALSAGTLDYSTLTKSIRRTQATSTGTAGSLAGLYTAEKSMRRGSGGDATGGFYFSCRFGLSTYVAGMTAMIGVWDLAAPLGSGDPSSLLANNNGIILYKDAADTNWKIARAAGGAVTTVDLGATYPSNTSDTDFYELRLHCPAAGGDVYYALHRLNTGDITEGSFNTVLPTSALLAPVVAASNRAVASVIALSVSNLYVTTDY